MKYKILMVNVMAGKKLGAGEPEFSSWNCKIYYFVKMIQN